MQELNSDKEMVMAPVSLEKYIGKWLLLITCLLKSNWYTYFTLYQQFLNFSEQTVRHGNSSLHVQELYSPGEDLDSKST
jgi:hypothetical protein